jgi:hypothetical protein
VTEKAKREIEKNTWKWRRLDKDMKDFFKNVLTSRFIFCGKSTKTHQMAQMIGYL